MEPWRHATDPIPDGWPSSTKSGAVSRRPTTSPSSCPGSPGCRRIARAIQIAENIETENWWAYLAEAIADAADEVTAATSTPVALGPERSLAGALPDTAAVRDGAARLAAELRAALVRLVPTGPPQASLAAAVAAAHLERALVTYR